MNSKLKVSTTDCSRPPSQVVHYTRVSRVQERSVVYLPTVSHFKFSPEIDGEGRCGRVPRLAGWNETSYRHAVRFFTSTFPLLLYPTIWSGRYTIPRTLLFPRSQLRTPTFESVKDEGDVEEIARRFSFGKVEQYTACIRNWSGYAVGHRFMK